MNNVLEIDGHKAVISFDPEIGLFRGEFVGLSGGADFYAESVEALKREAALSLRAYLAVCAENDIAPLRQFSGRFNVRLDPKVHEAAVTAATAQSKSLNEWVAEALAQAARTS